MEGGPWEKELLSVDAKTPKRLSAGTRMKEGANVWGDHL